MSATLIRNLPSSLIFKPPTEQLSTDGQAALSMERAKHILSAYRNGPSFLARFKDLMLSIGFTEDDVKLRTSKLWDLHIDPIICLDGAAATLLTIQINLAAGTLASYADDQPHHRDLLRKMCLFEVSYVTPLPSTYHTHKMTTHRGQFCLTELNHGLDALNIETTATILPGGGFELNTPHPGAAK